MAPKTARRIFLYIIQKYKFFRLCFGKQKDINFIEKFEFRRIQLKDTLDIKSFIDHRKLTSDILSVIQNQFDALKGIELKIQAHQLELVSLK